MFKNSVTSKKMPKSDLLYHMIKVMLKLKLFQMAEIQCQAN